MEKYKDLKRYKNIKEFITILQWEKLEQIIQLLVDEGYITLPDLLKVRTKKADVCQARRLVAFLARWKYNIDGAIIAKRLNLAESQVYAIIYSTFHHIQVEPRYREEIEKLKEKLKCI